MNGSDEDNGDRYSQWDFIRPKVEGKPIPVADGRVYRGFNQHTGEVHEGKPAFRWPAAARVLLEQLVGASLFHRGPASEVATRCS